MKKNPLINLLLVVALLSLTACATVEQPGSIKKSISTVEEKQGAAIREIGQFELVAYNAQGTELWRETATNSLADEGESVFLDCTLRATNCPTNYYLGLTDTTSTCSITDTTTLGTLPASEPSTNGYARQLIERSATGWPTLALDSGDFQATSSTETFTASGGSWGPVYCAFIATTTDGTGKLISYAALSTGRTLASGESLQITYKIKLQ
jgi:hypothetical protein